MGWPAAVKIVEVGPRDGLQNEPALVQASVKIELIERLAAAGLTVVEAGAFVSPRLVPQMADSRDVYHGLRQRPGVAYPALVANMKGLVAAIEAGVQEIAVFVSASEGFSQHNIACSRAESLIRLREVVETAHKWNFKIRGYVSCIAGCPYDGAVPPENVVAMTDALLAMGCNEISLGDTIGVGTAGQIRTIIDRVATYAARDKLAMHFHDTYGQALANIYASLLEGIAVFDSSVAGLGGCPYAKGASGNVASEDVLYMFNGLDIATGIDLDKLIAAGQRISQLLGRANGSRVARARQAG